jgi:hypothetical protein
MIMLTKQTKKESQMSKVGRVSSRWPDMGWDAHENTTISMVVHSACKPSLTFVGVYERRSGIG